jgi:hypothetical protein
LATALFKKWGAPIFIEIKEIKTKSKMKRMALTIEYNLRLRPSIAFPAGTSTIEPVRLTRDLLKLLAI